MEPGMNRRPVLGAGIGAAATVVGATPATTGARQEEATVGVTVEPFVPRMPEATIADLRERLRHTR